VVVVTSVNRLVAARPHSVAHWGTRSGHHHEALGDLGKDHDPSDGINTIALSSANQVTNTELTSHASRARPVFTIPTSSDWASATALPAVESKRVLDTNPQLKGRLTADLMNDESVRNSYLQIAEAYDAMANNEERMAGTSVLMAKIAAE
jgi:hypothetical protein